MTSGVQSRHKCHPKQLMTSLLTTALLMGPRGAAPCFPRHPESQGAVQRWEIPVLMQGAERGTGNPSQDLSIIVHPQSTGAEPGGQAGKGLWGSVQSPGIRGEGMCTDCGLAEGLWGDGVRRGGNKCLLGLCGEHCSSGNWVSGHKITMQQREDAPPHTSKVFLTPGLHRQHLSSPKGTSQSSLALPPKASMQCFCSTAKGVLHTSTSVQRVLAHKKYPRRRVRVLQLHSSTDLGREWRKAGCGQPCLHTQ